jgi:hypothetical protein
MWESPPAEISMARLLRLKPVDQRLIRHCRSGKFDLPLLYLRLQSGDRRSVLEHKLYARMFKVHVRTNVNCVRVSDSVGEDHSDVG